uniref:WAT1-related protein n=1 Tax=Kalanchoe fedtschenkoi TaxID=63787 RepID=A0A7N0T214_KALFE
MCRNVVIWALFDRATLNQYLYFLGLKYSTPTIACAINNTLPAITFLLAVPFGLEKLGIRQRAGQAKLVGTVVCVGGAMLLSFYNGSTLKVPPSGIHWTYAEKLGHEAGSHSSLLGPVLVIGSCVSWATNVSKKYPAPFSSTALMCLASSLQSAVISVAMDRSASAWSLTPAIRLVSTLYAGIVCSALAYCLISWAIAHKGPLYVSVFNPLLLVMVAFMSWALLDEKLFVGTAVGSVLIVAGLYCVLWGKNKEMADPPGCQCRLRIIVFRWGKETW